MNQVGLSQILTKYFSNHELYVFLARTFGGDPGLMEHMVDPNSTSPAIFTLQVEMALRGRGYIDDRLFIAITEARPSAKADIEQFKQTLVSNKHTEGLRQTGDLFARRSLYSNGRLRRLLVTGRLPSEKRAVTLASSLSIAVLWAAEELGALELIFVEVDGEGASVPSALGVCLSSSIGAHNGRLFFSYAHTDDTSEVPPSLEELLRRPTANNLYASVEDGLRAASAVISVGSHREFPKWHQQFRSGVRPRPWLGLETYGMSAKFLARLTHGIYGPTHAALSFATIRELREQNTPAPEVLADALLSMLSFDPADRDLAPDNDDFADFVRDLRTIDEQRRQPSDDGVGSIGIEESSSGNSRSPLLLPSMLTLSLRAAIGRLHLYGQDPPALSAEELERTVRWLGGRPASEAERIEREAARLEGLVREQQRDNRRKSLGLVVVGVAALCVTALMLWSNQKSARESNLRNTRMLGELSRWRDTDPTYRAIALAEELGQGETSPLLQGTTEFDLRDLRESMSVSVPFGQLPPPSLVPRVYYMAISAATAAKVVVYERGAAPWPLDGIPFYSSSFGDESSKPQMWHYASAVPLGEIAVDTKLSPIDCTPKSPAAENRQSASGWLCGPPPESLALISVTLYHDRIPTDEHVNNYSFTVAPAIMSKSLEVVPYFGVVHLAGWKSQTTKRAVPILAVPDAPRRTGDGLTMPEHRDHGDYVPLIRRTPIANVFPKCAPAIKPMENAPPQSLLSAALNAVVQEVTADRGATDADIWAEMVEKSVPSMIWYEMGASKLDGNPLTACELSKWTGVLPMDATIEYLFVLRAEAEKSAL